MSQSLVEKRKRLHQIAELSMQERQTADQVEAWLSAYEPDRLESGLGGTGILAVWEGVEEGPTTLLRCELDALPIKEINTFAHRSETKGVSHKCGHDGHMTIILGVAEYLHAHPPVNGTIALLFQPGEETGEGAVAVLEEERFRELQPDRVFALHNLPGYPLGHVILKKGGFTPAVKSLLIYLEGKTSHAAEPENGINPGLCIAEMLQYSDRLAHPDLGDPEFSVVTPIYITLGEKAYGISAGYGELHLTIRTWTEKQMEILEAQMLEGLQEIAEKHQLPFRYEWSHVFQANYNAEEPYSWLEKVVERKKLKHLHREYPFKWGEDFGAFTQEYPGAMFGIGSGEDCPALHNPDYDFPDALIEYGVDAMMGILEELHDLK